MQPPIHAQVYTLDEIQIYELASIGAEESIRIKTLLESCQCGLRNARDHGIAGEKQQREQHRGCAKSGHAMRASVPNLTTGHFRMRRCSSDCKPTSIHSNSCCRASATQVGEAHEVVFLGVGWDLVAADNIREPVANYTVGLTILLPGRDAMYRTEPMSLDDSIDSFEVHDERKTDIHSAAMRPARAGVRTALQHDLRLRGRKRQRDDPASASATTTNHRFTSGRHECDGRQHRSSHDRHGDWHPSVGQHVG
jgi:hypothetical protein